MFMAPNITCAMIPDRRVFSTQHLNQIKTKRLLVLSRITNSTSAHCSVTLSLSGFHRTPKERCLVAFLERWQFCLIDRRTKDVKHVAFLYSLRQYADKAANRLWNRDRLPPYPFGTLWSEDGGENVAIIPTNVTWSNVGELSWSSLFLVHVLHKGDVTRDNSQRRFLRNAALQHCCDIVSSGCNIVPTLQRFVVLKIVIANRFL